MRLAGHHGAAAARRGQLGEAEPTRAGGGPRSLLLRRADGLHPLLAQGAGSVGTQSGGAPLTLPPLLGINGHVALVKHISFPAMYSMYNIVAAFHSTIL